MYLLSGLGITYNTLASLGIVTRLPFLSISKSVDGETSLAWVVEATLKLSLVRNLS
jgi:hypothetical protein